MMTNGPYLPHHQNGWNKTKTTSCILNFTFINLWFKSKLVLGLKNWWSQVLEGSMNLKRKSTTKCCCRFVAMRSCSCATPILFNGVVMLVTLDILWHSKHFGCMCPYYFSRDVQEKFLFYKSHSQVVVWRYHIMGKTWDRYSLKGQRLQGSQSFVRGATLTILDFHFKRFFL